jgi:hypothetical protein
MQLRSGAKSSQTARVLSSDGWWTDTGTDTTWCQGQDGHVGLARRGRGGDRRRDRDATHRQQRCPWWRCDPAAAVAAVAGRRHRQRPGPRLRIPLRGGPPGLRRRLSGPRRRPAHQPGPDRGRAGRYGRHQPGAGRWDRGQAGHPHPARPGLRGHPRARPGQDRHPGRRVPPSASPPSPSLRAATATTSLSSGSTPTPTSAPPPATTRGSTPWPSRR